MKRSTEQVCDGAILDRAILLCGKQLLLQDSMIRRTCVPVPSSALLDVVLSSGVVVVLRRYVPDSNLYSAGVLAE